MPHPGLTFRSVTARPVVLKLKRPVVARIATITDWPLILIDLFTEEGIVGRSYLEPYIVKSMRYLVPALQDLGDMLKGRRVAPLELYDAARKSLHFVGYRGLVDDCRLRAGHGGVGRAGEGGGPAALRAAGRLGRAGEILQQQWTVAEGAGSRRGGGARAARRGRLHRPQAAARPRSRPR